jgi:hypothetical protein
MMVGRLVLYSAIAVLLAIVTVGGVTVYVGARELRLAEEKADRFTPSPGEIGARLPIRAHVIQIVEVHR